MNYGSLTDLPYNESKKGGKDQDVQLSSGARGLSFGLSLPLISLKGPRVRASPGSLRCVIEQGSLILA